MTTSAVTLAVRQWTPRLRDVLRAIRSRLPQGQRQADPYVTPLAKSVLSYDPPRSKCLEQVVAFVVDQAQRGDLADAERLGSELMAIARTEWERIHSLDRLTISEAHIAEEHAQGLMEETETAVVHDNSVANRAKYYAAKACYEVASDRLETVLHRYDREVAR